jgi:predicted PurR-regulated permease PerM
VTVTRLDEIANGQADERPVAVSLTPRGVVVFIGITFAALLLLALGYLALDAISWFLVAAFFAMALNPVVEALVRRGARRGPAAAVVFVLAFALIVGIGFVVVPPIVTAVEDFLAALPGYLRQLDAGRGPLGFLERKFHVGEHLLAVYERGGIAAVFGLERPGAGAARAAAGTLLAALAVPFLTFFMLLDGKRWVRSVIDAAPAPARPTWERVAAGIYRVVGGYVTGNLLISLVAGVVAGVTFLAVGVPFALPLAVVVAILDLIPLVGATIAIVLSGLVAATQGPVAMIVVVSVLLIYQQIENHALQPIVYGRTVDMSPLAVLVSVLLGAELAGVLGALAAIPVGGSISVAASEVVRWRREDRHGRLTAPRASPSSSPTSPS